MDLHDTAGTIIYYEDKLVRLAEKQKDTPHGSRFSRFLDKYSQIIKTDLKRLYEDFQERVNDSV
jgi:hypothetical protein